MSCGGIGIVAAKWCCWEGFQRTIVGACNAPITRLCGGDTGCAQWDESECFPGLPS